MALRCRVGRNRCGGVIVAFHRITHDYRHDRDGLFAGRSRRQRSMKADET
ncbi:MAG: hypothetical protein KF810_15005 [Rhizobiaceae bacterium]|nr:hypothetical protein [Rhizobiaceae bacterium]